MISISTELLTLFNSRPRQFYMAEIYEFSTVYGQTLYYTSTDVAVTIGATTYQPMRISRSDIVLKSGLDVGEVTVTFYPKSTDSIGSQTFISGIESGMLDGASCSISRAYFSPDWSTYVGTLPRFTGRVSEMQDFSWYQVPVTIRSRAELLDTQMPKSVYQPTCRRTLFDTGCALTASSWAVSSSVNSGSTVSQILCGLTQSAGSTGAYSGQIGTGDGQTTQFELQLSQIIESIDTVTVGGSSTTAYSASYQGTVAFINFTTAPGDGLSIVVDATYAIAGYFDQGKIVFTSGTNSGIFRSVKAYSPGFVHLVPPLPVAPSPGDTFTIYPGCDKTAGTCDSTFSNTSHYSGEPYIPQPETAY